MNGSGIVETIRGAGVVDSDPASEALELLLGLLAAGGADDDAIGIVQTVIGRMDQGDPLTALADWWLVVEFGVHPVTPLAYSPRENLSPVLRDAMHELLTLQGPSPKAPWMRDVLRYREMMEQLDDRLDLEYYGQSRLTQERDVWDDLLETLQPTITGVRSTAPAPNLHFDLSKYERSMTKASIVKSSRRWNEMSKRAQELVDFLSQLVELQHKAALGSHVTMPPARTHADLGIEGATALTILCVGPLIEDRRVMLDHGRVSELLDEAAKQTDDAGRVLLTKISDSWMAATGTTIASLSETVSRLRSLSIERERLERSGVDVTELELALLDNDLAAAERVVEELGDARRASEIRARQRATCDRLRVRIEGVREFPIEDLLNDLATAESTLDSDHTDTVTERLSEIESSLRQRQQRYVADRLRWLHADLERIEAPAELLDELTADEELALRGQLNDLSVVERFEAFIETRTNELLTVARSNLDDARERLNAAGDTLQPEHHVEFEAVLEQLAERLSELTSHSSLDDIISTHAESEDIGTEIDRRRRRRWRSSEGEGVLVDHVIDFCTQQLSFEEMDILKLYVALKTKPFVIIAGLTGTGKSTIARLFAEAIGATTSNGGFRRVAVRPDWIDQAEVLGFINPLSRVFEPGWLAESVQRCNANPDRMFVVLLDEMNLAPAEQYLAEYLSAGEEFRSGSGDVRIPLYNPGVSPVNGDQWPPDLAFPSNLLVIGTVNMDETTRVLSERVLDRANVIQLSVDVNSDHHFRTHKFVQPWTVPAPEWRRVTSIEPSTAHHSFLVDLATLMRTEMGIGLGVRAHIEIERFIANAHGVLDEASALDLALLQRLIPKIRGFKRELSTGLEQLLSEFRNEGCERCALVLQHWLSAGISDDEFLDGTSARIGLLT